MLKLALVSFPPSPWKVIDASTFAPVAEETRGIRAKQWVKDDQGAIWLRKSHRASRPVEPVVETLTARLAAAAGLNVPETHACAWSSGQRGILVRRFGDEDEELTEGSALLARAQPGYDSTNHSLHSLAAVRDCLIDWEANNRDNRSLLESFAHMIAFDIWVGNGDRHQENWGILLRGTKPEARMAPIYDTAACLGAEVGDPKWSPTRRTTYIERCPSGFGDGTAQLPMRAVAEEIRLWPEWQANARTWHSSFADPLEGVQGWLDLIPADWVSPTRRDVMVDLLRERLSWMEEFLP